MKVLQVILLASLVLCGHKKKNSTDPLLREENQNKDKSKSLFSLFTKSDLDSLLSMLTSSVTKYALPSNFIIHGDLALSNSSITVEINGENNVVHVKLQQGPIIYLILVDLEENNITLKIDDMCINLDLPNTYRIESISVLATIWSMFSSQITDKEYQFPSFFPEEMRVILTFSADGKLAKVKYAPLKYDLKVALPGDMEYNKYKIDIKDGNCVNVNDQDGIMKAYEKLKGFVANSLNP